VSRDRSLEEFVGDASDGESDADHPKSEANGSGHPEDVEEAGDDTEATAPGPIATTYRWSAGGETCELCGERVETRWRAEEAFVCVDCKEW
jgi:hypothetical protein